MSLSYKERFRTGRMDVFGYLESCKYRYGLSAADIWNGFLVSTDDDYIQKIGNVYVMFYFGAFWPGTKGAFNRFACSYDLVNWTDVATNALPYPGNGQFTFTTNNPPSPTFLRTRSGN